MVLNHIGLCIGTTSLCFYSTNSAIDNSITQTGFNVPVSNPTNSTLQNLIKTVYLSKQYVIKALIYKSGVSLTSGTPIVVEFKN